MNDLLKAGLWVGGGLLLLGMVSGSDQKVVGGGQPNFTSVSKKDAGLGEATEPLTYNISFPEIPSNLFGSEPASAPAAVSKKSSSSGSTFSSQSLGGQKVTLLKDSSGSLQSANVGGVDFTKKEAATAYVGGLPSLRFAVANDILGVGRT